MQSQVLLSVPVCHKAIPSDNSKAGVCSVELLFLNHGAVDGKMISMPHGFESK